MVFSYNDGGRSKYFKGSTGDCVTRAICQLLDKDYKEVYDDLKKIMGKGKSPRNGVPKKIYHKYLLSNGAEWETFTTIGSGITKRMNSNDLPKGNYICRLKGHLAFVSDHVLHDTWDSSWDGSAGVYGVYRMKGKS